MTKCLLLISSLLIICFSVKAQENTLNNQFNTITQKSNNYKDYKVVKKNQLNALQKNVLDTVAFLHNEVEASSSKVIQQKSEISLLNKELTTTKDELTISKKNENDITAFGIATKKQTYTIIMSSLIVILLLIIAVLFYNFKNSYRIIKSVKKKIKETDDEYEGFRQRSLEREQLLRRKLQDELKNGTIS